MNTTFKSIFNRSLGAWVAAAETVSAGGKASRCTVHANAGPAQASALAHPRGMALNTLAAAVLMAATGQVWATCTTVGNVMTCTDPHAGAILVNSGTGVNTLNVSGTLTTSTVSTVIDYGGGVQLNQDGGTINFSGALTATAGGGLQLNRSIDFQLLNGTINNSGSVSVVENFANGIGIQAVTIDANGASATISQTNTGSVQTAGRFSPGMYVDMARKRGISTFGAVTATFNADGMIMTSGEGSAGIAVGGSGAGLMFVILSGDIETSGNVSPGISTTAALVSPSGGLPVLGGGQALGADILVGSSGTISTQGNDASGVYVNMGQNNIGGIGIRVENQGAITTAGVNAHGVFSREAWGNSPGPVPGSLNMRITSSGTILTSGNTSNGIDAGIVDVPFVSGPSSGPAGLPIAKGNITINQTSGSISTTGQFSSGIVTFNPLVGEYSSVVNISGAVSGGWAGSLDAEQSSVQFGAAGVTYWGDADISVAAGATLGALSDTAILGRNLNVVPTPGAAGVRTHTGSASIINAGTITGNIQTGNVAVGANAATADGDDILINTGTWNLRKWADTNGDGVRDLVADSISHFGTGTNTIQNSGFIGLTSVPGHAAAQNAFITDTNKAITFNNRASGVLSLQEGAGFAGDRVTIEGNYNGEAGSQLRLDVRLEGDDVSSAFSDKLVITGDTTGSTAVLVSNAGGAGAGTGAGAGIKIIQVDGNSSVNSFTMSAPLQVGIYEYNLRQGGADDSNDWYLRGNFRPVVPTYVLGQYANMQAGLMQVGTLHQRMGEQRHAQGEHKQLWMRLLGDKDRASGSADWAYTQSSYGLQLGVDLVNRTSTPQGSQRSNQRAGLTLAYRDSRADFKDKTRSTAGLGSDIGQLSSSQLTLGAYYTDMAPDGSYLDLVGNIGQLRNRYNNIDTGQATQRGWQAQLSAEVGKPIYQSQSGWQLEPQAQLIYQYTRYQGFSDSQFAVGSYSSDQLRGRVGLRLFKDGGSQEQPNNIYLIANLMHDFMKADPISIDNTPVGQSYDRTRAEIGLGVQSKFSKTGYFYADARYSKSLRGHSESGQANVGMKIAW